MAALLLLGNAMGAPVAESAALAPESQLTGLTRKLVELYQHAENGDLSREAEFHATVAKFNEAHEASSETAHGRQLHPDHVLSEPSECYSDSWQNKKKNKGVDCTVWCTTDPSGKKLTSNVNGMISTLGGSVTAAEVKNSQKCNSMDFTAKQGDMTVVCLGKDACNSVELECKKKRASCTIYCDYGKPACNSVTLKDKYSKGGSPSIIMYKKKENANSIETEGKAAIKAEGKLY